MKDKSHKVGEVRNKKIKRNVKITSMIKNI